MKKGKRRQKKKAPALSKLDKNLYFLTFVTGVVALFFPYLIFLFVRNKIYLNFDDAIGYADTPLCFSFLLSMVLPLIPIIYFVGAEQDEIPIKVAFQSLLKDLRKRILVFSVLAVFILSLLLSLFCGSAMLDTQGTLHVYPVYTHESRSYDLSQIDKIEIEFASSVSPLSAGNKIELVFTVHLKDSKKYEIWHFNHEQFASHLFLFENVNVSVRGVEHLEEWFSRVDLNEKGQVLWREFLASRR